MSVAGLPPSIDARASLIPGDDSYSSSRLNFASAVCKTLDAGEATGTTDCDPRSHSKNLLKVANTRPCPIWHDAKRTILPAASNGDYAALTGLHLFDLRSRPFHQFRSARADPYVSAIGAHNTWSIRAAPVASITRRSRPSAMPEASGIAASAAKKSSSSG